ncbi:transcription factor LRL2 isoform X1 [Cannabis sativa]|uniref:transcription factor LRL2 isoform X1 n=1 Tax=Cannabis sativa TaxID=3483 RepID=UPI0029C9D54B|nr:transcription factor LRL2 isoform X1 [Cannabis sativa]
MSKRINIEEVLASSPLVKMEGESSKNNIPMQVKSSSFVGYSGNVVTIGTAEEDDRRGPVLMENGGRSWPNKNNVLCLPWWDQVQHQKNHNYVQSLTEKSSAFPQMNLYSQDILENLSLAEGEPASAYAVSGVSDLQREVLLYNHLGLASGSTPTNVGAWKNLTSLNKNSFGKNYNSGVDIPSATVASPGSVSQDQSTIQRKRNLRNDQALSKQQRRKRYAETLNKLQELLPKSAEGVGGSQVSVFDDVIDYIKYLQLQIKDLSESRLGGESPTKPIIFREGYGHYFYDQETLNEPLEEIIMAKWLEVNSLAVTNMLERKGLLLMPIEFTEALQ